MDPELQATVDHVAIARLQDAYADGVTRRDWAAVEALFLPGAIVELDLVDRPRRAIDGSTALVSFIAGAIECFSFFEFVILNRRIDLWPDDDRDAATARVFMCELRLPEGETERDDAFGLYRDRYLRVDGRWRIAGRRYRSMARFPAGTVFPLDQA